MKIWNTKYCLTQGITQHEVEEPCNGSDIVTLEASGSFSVYLYKEGSEWHRTEEQAITKADELKINKLQSLDRQIKKISALVFECEEEKL